MKNMRNKRGRPSTRSYSSEAELQSRVDQAKDIYQMTGQIKAVAEEMNLHPQSVKKLLITAGVLKYEITTQIQQLLAEGKSIDEIAKIKHLSRVSINTYLPYEKCAYNTETISANADRVKKYKTRKSALKQFANTQSEDDLWTCIVAFQGYPFYTASGLPFTYTLKEGKHGGYTKELFIDRREESKSLSWSSIKLAFEKAMAARPDTGEPTLFKKPKAIGDIRGISYCYPILWRFGVISVTPEVEDKLKGRLQRVGVNRHE